MLLGYTPPAATEEMLCGGKRWDSQKERLRKTNRSSGFCHAVRWKLQWQIVCPSPCSASWLFKAIQLWLINYNLPWVLFFLPFAGCFTEVIWVEVWEGAIKRVLSGLCRCVCTVGEIWRWVCCGCDRPCSVTDRDLGAAFLFNYSLSDGVSSCTVLRPSQL